jgi:hypothetical protein
MQVLTQLNIALCPKSDVVETLHLNLDDDLEVGQGPDVQEVSAFKALPEIGLPPAMEEPNPSTCHGIDIAPVGGVTIGVSEQLLQELAIGCSWGRDGSGVKPYFAMARVEGQVV